MKTEFHTGSLQELATWLNYSAENPPEGHKFVTSEIKEFAAGLMAQVIFLTPVEMEQEEEEVDIDDEIDRHL